jgi:hypothetical protein
MNIVSFSLFGKAPRYFYGALANARLAQTLLPTWICRFYVERKSDKYCNMFVRELSQMKNVEIVPMDFASRYLHERVNEGMFWRFRALTGPARDDGHWTLFRDCDSRLSHRETAAIDKWISSGLAIFTIRDHERHYDKPVRGGLWGVRRNFCSPNSHEWAKDHAMTTPGADETYANDVWNHVEPENRFVASGEIWRSVGLDHVDVVHYSLLNFKEDVIDYIGQPISELEDPIPC